MTYASFESYFHYLQTLVVCRDSRAREIALFSPDLGIQEQLKHLGTDYPYLRVTCDVLIFVVNFYWIPQTPVVQCQLGNLQELGANRAS